MLYPYVELVLPANNFEKGAQGEEREDPRLGTASGRQSIEGAAEASNAYFFQEKAAAEKKLESEDPTASNIPA